ncbi:hypothetical protein BC831DRAFT_161067 [Entophlyctis helioformis]|nr:hypothetical protein BC831DRAFT_161067 [Entophlyctis helioformis]
MTTDDLKAALLVAAGFSELDLDYAFLWLARLDGGHLPVDARALPANTLEDPYILQISKPPTMPKEVPPPSIEEIAGQLKPLNDLSAKVDDVNVLMVNLQNLRRKLERMDVDKLTFGKPFGMLSKFPKRLDVFDKRYLDEPRYTFGESTKAWLRSPTFDNWQWDDNELLGLFELIFDELGLIAEYSIKRVVLRKFLLTIRENYNNNPFHNFKHSFCVTQMMYGIINVTGLIDKLKPLEKLILTVACIGHDLDHPGYNNAYQINAKTELAIIYNDNAPLEMHHAACLFGILKHRDCNILETLSDTVYREARKGIIRCILSTDMARHGEILTQFKKVADGFNYDDAESRALLLSMVIKCSDISNEVRPADVAEPWVNCLLEEFFSQSDREKAEGLPTAPFMDREKVTKPSAQIGFIGYVMIPLYELMGKVLPNMDQYIISPIKESLAYYKDLLEKEKC